MKNNDKQSIQNILLESVWVTRWNKTKSAIYAVLTPEEAMTISNDIIKNLKSAGYVVVKKYNIKTSKTKI